jgi:UDP-2,4-diacetamido-2,4,6-trideoxy-beta-L-altropyranose hydrolase
MGHVVRCLALAQMLRDYFHITFALQETDEMVYNWIQQQGFPYRTLARTTDFQLDSQHFIHDLTAATIEKCIVVLDGYHFETTYQKTLQQAGFKVVAIDDLHSWHHTAQAVINHAPGASEAGYTCNANTRLLLGLDYALLRPEIRDAKRTIESVKYAENFLISMGASDENNRTQFFALLLIKHFPQAQIKLLMSTLNPHYRAIQTLSSAHPNISIYMNLGSHELVEALLETDVVICPASTISIEACALGCSLITGYTAPNQMGILEGLSLRGAAHSLGDLNALNEQEALASIQHFSNDLKARKEQFLHQRALLDGKSDRRIALAFLEIQYNCSVRNASANDARLYFDWANDPAVRANSYQSADISWDDHIKWFETVTTSPSWQLWLYHIDGLPAAQMRLKIEEQKATINYSISHAYRGKGLSFLLLKHAALKISLQRPEVEYLEGWVKKSNLPSYRAFIGSGYEIAEETNDSILFRIKVKR